MTRIHLDAVGGIAGDMFVAALLDAFPELTARVMADAAAVLPEGAGRPFLDEGQSGALRALRFGLSGGEPGKGEGGYPEIVARIGEASLSEGAAAHAVAILTIVAEAEARIHAVPVERVHFHEIAGWDSLLDVVAAGSIAAALGQARWSVSDLPRGGGLVRTEHGALPVPAPATVMILEGFAWRDDGVAGERVTPTGAAILRHLVAAGSTPAGGTLRGSGTGAGTRELPGMPNILRALVFDAARPSHSDRVTVLAFEVDYMTGEEIGVAAERLRAEAGVLDLSIGQRWGKKGRPLQSFQLIVRPDAAPAVIARCFEESSTIGLRVQEDSRIVLPRDSAAVDGVGVKSVRRPLSGRTAKAESDHLVGDTLSARRAEKLRAEGKVR